MTIQSIDHLVIITQHLQSCLDFYVGLLGMQHAELDGHHNLFFGQCKISIHTLKGEFQPSATHPEYGSQDFCLVVDDLSQAKRDIERSGYPIVEGLVSRQGAKGLMQSLYLYDPDGNLVELCQYV